ncbi:hypothetical protein C9374_006150 [Naegleria lovaniensis]|uniref:Charged multivesicular body protein 6 n=1 Tax=Naegleria lovaniensis TaxID=51637 RepID=A0AA88GIT2_NAELO|nr:uncharacterized protein C9374_006150 [Naegleria lovaniensis]KAG2381766.1 hypothetical protein C9374_006150 [Naegleria lovaniensis]
MGALFSLFKKQESKVNEHDKAVLELKSHRDKVKVYQKKLSSVIEKERDVAKTLLKEGKKEKALLALKKKKYQESLLDKTQKQLENLQNMVDQLEFAQIEKQVFDGLKQGKQALEILQKEMGSIEDIEKLMEESREAIQYQEEISRIISESLTPDDIHSVEEDLNELEAVMLQEKLPQVNKTPLPKMSEPKKDDIEIEEDDRKPVQL